MADVYTSSNGITRVRMDRKYGSGDVIYIHPEYNEFGGLKTATVTVNSDYNHTSLSFPVDVWQAIVEALGVSPFPTSPQEDTAIA